jgi:ring hydroxylating enzyme alpha subunit
MLTLLGGSLPRIQAGMRSAAFTGLHLSTQEVRIQHFHHTLMRYLEKGDGAPSAGPAV